MSLNVKVEMLSLMSALITEILDDDDDDDDNQLLLEVATNNLLAECRDRSKRYEGHMNRISSKEQSRMAKALAYLRVSRFEKFSVPSPECTPDELTCKKTYKSISGQCVCKDHANIESNGELSLLIVQKDGPSISDLDFKTHWHMSKSTVQLVYTLINQSEEPNFIKIEPVELLMVLWHLANDEPIDALELRFATSKVAINSAKVTVLERLCLMRDRYEIWPTSPVAVDIVTRGFTEKGGLPGTLGAVGIVHFPCPKPAFQRKSYINSQGQTSIAIQLACDHRGSITHSSYNFWPGGREDTFIYKYTKLNRLPVPENAYLTGNSCYAKSKHVLTPFTGNVNQAQNNFNVLHRNSMSVLHSAVRALTNRFKQLLCLTMTHSSYVRQSIGACIVLHNICTDVEDSIDLDSDFSVNSFFPVSHPTTVLSPSPAIQKRNNVCADLNKDKGLFNNSKRKRTKGEETLNYTSLPCLVDD